MIIESFFPTLIYGKDIKIDNRLFEKEIIEWSKKDPGVQKTNRKGWHSTTEMHKIPVFKPLVNEILVTMNEIWEKEWLDRVPVLGNMWANINPPGAYNAPHIHPNSLFSGVYYVKAPKNSGRLVCNDPRAGVQLNMPVRKEGQPPKELWRDCTLEPKEGRLIIFPFYLWHNVESNLSEDLRISVSFNIIQHGF
tara:strand:+ start:1477 stop:2055 length:579 start_codon:yes stop_codon:yes gene_type:complete